MDPRHELLQNQTRRHFLRQSTAGIGAMALASLLQRESKSDGVVNPLAPRARISHRRRLESSTCT